MSLHIKDLRQFMAAICLTAGVLIAPPAARATDAETELRRILAWQIALERIGFSPGIIDGKEGPKTHLATRELQRVLGLPQTGRLDAATAKALKVSPDEVLVRYRIHKSDFDEIGHVPDSWIERSKLKFLGHESLEDVICEKFHCTRELLERLNRGTRFKRLRAGDRVVVPYIPEPAPPRPAKYIEINLAEKVIRVVDRQDQLAALFHCSVAKDKSNLPSGKARVVAIAQDPWYTFDPEMWPEVTERITGKLAIPPGPRNPVGRCWIALSLPGYGIHGTPSPELIGKTGSHGCFRLTNWDAIRLSKMVQPGTPVRFAAHPDDRVASSSR